MDWPIRVIWEGKASSSYDQTTIDRRLEVLADRQDEEAKREVEFLQSLKENTHATTE